MPAGAAEGGWGPDGGEGEAGLVAAPRRVTPVAISYAQSSKQVWRTAEPGRTLPIRRCLRLARPTVSGPNSAGLAHAALPCMHAA